MRKRPSKKKTLHKKMAMFLCGVCFPLMLSSCATVGPDFKGLDAPIQERWLEEDAKRFVSQGDNVLWWENFKDPKLNELIEKAHQQNLTLQMAALRIIEAQARLGIAIGAQFPQDQNVSGSYSSQYKNNRKINKQDVKSASDWGYGLALNSTWELDLWGRYRRGVEASEASLLASYASYDNIFVSITAEIAKAYITLCSFEDRLKIAKKNVAVQRRSLQITRVRFKNASTTELDVRQAETLLMQTQSLIPSLEQGIEQSKNALAILLGMTPSDLRKNLDTRLRLPKAPKTITTGIPADLLRRRPDIRQAELLAASQSALIGVEKADLFPSFYIGGALGVLGGDVTYEGRDEYTYALIQPGFSWKILNFGRIKNSVRAQDARFQQAIVNYENTVLGAYREVEDNLVGYTRTNEQSRYLGRAVRASRRSVDLALIQYRDGQIDYNPVITTQSTLTQQQDQYIVSKANALLYLVGIYRSLGGGWESLSGKEMLAKDTKQAMQARSDWGEMLQDTNKPMTQEKVQSPIPKYTLGKKK